MKRNLHKKIRNVDLWDKHFIVNNHYCYKKAKRMVNKEFRRIIKKELKKEN